LNLTERDNLILEAALEFGADYYYEIKNGTLGITLYIEAPNKDEAGRIRKEAPCFWNNLYVVVLYSNNPDFSDDVQYDPQLS
jgi:hypothetical protein